MADMLCSDPCLTHLVHGLVWSLARCPEALRLTLPSLIRHVPVHNSSLAPKPPMQQAAYYAHRILVAKWTEVG
jgi:hypothetical protein